MGEGALRGKTVLVTGAGRGIGQATARALAREGARLVLVDNGCDVAGRGHDPSVIDEVGRELVRGGASVVTSAEDMSEPAAAVRAIERGLASFGHLDGVVACAGVVRERAIQNLEFEDLESVLGVHVRGVFALTAAAAQAMIARGAGGSIVLFTSPSAFFGSGRQSVGAAGAGAIVGLTRSAAVDLRKHGIRVNAIAPTARTRATEHQPTFQGIREDSMTPEHAAAVAVFFASDEGAAVTGEVLGVAGRRVYAFRPRETTGAFFEELPTSSGLHARWHDITRS